MEDGRPGGLETKDARKRIFSFSFVFASRLLGETYLSRKIYWECKNVIGWLA